jgi:glycosyltransferase involved in cell wall biosynthesis
MQGKKIKIALVYDVIFPYVTGGAERRYFEVGRRLAKQGYDVHLYGMKSWEGEDVISMEGMTLHAIMPQTSLYTVSGRRSIAEAFRFGLATLRLLKEPFDVIDCCGFPYFSLFSLRLVTWIRGKRLYSTWHEVWGKKYWQEYLGILGIFGYIIERGAAILPDRIISVSESTTKALKNKLGRKRGIVTIPNGIDLELIRQTEASPENFDIIFAGRLLRHKNADKVLQALPEVKKAFPHIKFIIIGDGPEKKRLEELSHCLNLESNVRFMGFVEENKLFSYMKSSKLLVLPSSREGFGMVALEARACGLPVLTVDEPHNAACRLVTECGNGVITRLDPASIAQGIKSILANPKKETEEPDIEKHDWKNVVRKIEHSFALKNNN